MDISENGILSVNRGGVEIREYSNGSVLFINYERPTWVRSSTTGLWAYKYLADNPGTMEQVVEAITGHYQLPSTLIRENIKKFLSEMTTFGFISDSSGIQETTYQITTLEDFPLQELWVDITSECLGSCRHCYKPKTEKIHFPMIEFGELLKQARDMNVKLLTLSGGDPLLHPGISEILELARSISDWTVKIITAGHGADEKKIDSLLKNTDIIQVSVDGTTPETNDLIRGAGTFEKAIYFIKNLFEHEGRDNVKVGISFTPLPENMVQIPKIDSFAYALGIDFIHFNNVKRPAGILPRRNDTIPFNDQEFFSRSLEVFRELNSKMWMDIRDSEGLVVRPVALDISFAPYLDLFDMIKKKNCGGGVTMITINEKGEVYPCPALQDYTDQCLGNWFDVHNLSTLHDTSKRWNRDVFSVDTDEQCKVCGFRYICGGGCRARGDTVSSPDTMCSIIQNNYNEFFKYIGPATIEQEERKEETIEIQDQFRIRKCN